jgi:hypothetical protein
MKATVPVGEPATADVTDAVKVTGWPKTEGVLSLATATVLVAALTTSETEADAPAPWLASPP